MIDKTEHVLLSVALACRRCKMTGKWLLLSLLAVDVTTAAAGVSAKRVFRRPRYDRGMLGQQVEQPIDEAAWLWHPACAPDAPNTGRGVFFARRSDGEAESKAVFLRFRCPFVSDGTPFTLDITADERFVLQLDGVFIARGPNRSWPENWQCQTYEICVPSGDHVLEAVVCHLGELAPITQMSCRGGFCVRASGGYDGRLTTGKAPWKVGRLAGSRMMSGFVGHGAMGCAIDSCGTGFEDEHPCEWLQPEIVADGIRTRPSSFNWGLRRPGWLTYPSELPDQTERRMRPGSFRSGPVALLSPLLSGGEVTIPENSHITAIWDLDDYFCAYPELVSERGKGAEVRISFVESLVDDDGRKGMRDAVEGKAMPADGKYLTDLFRCDGRDHARFTTPWWRAGRFVSLDIRTLYSPLTIKSLAVIESRYPLEAETVFETPDDPTLAAVQKIGLRALQNCCHEMLMDCPFYEQQMYAADTRVQLLTITALSSDDRTIRRAMDIYDLGRRDNGLPPNNWPTRNYQESSMMALNYLAMYGDYVMWHRNDEWLKARFPGVMNTLLAIWRQENAEGLLEDTDGSSFVDWVSGWTANVTPVARGNGPSAVENLFYIEALRSVAKLSTAVGERAFADWCEARAERIGNEVVRRFWNDERALLADGLDRKTYSQHAQVLAIRLGILPAADERRLFDSLLADKGLLPGSVYFKHYLFEALSKYGRADMILRELDLWREYVAHGLRTTVESPDLDLTRSDCHGWGSHPIYHLRTALAGIRPDALGFARVRIAPCLGPLRAIRASVPHPSGGQVRVEFRIGENNSISGIVDTPVPGVFVWNGREVALSPGKTEVSAK